MNKKWPAPLVVTLLIILIGIYSMIMIKDHWHTELISIENPIINKINKKPETPDIKTIIHEAEKDVVQIEGQGDDHTITGSGFLYNEKGDIITNAHVVKEADIIYVRTANAHVYPASIVGIGKSEDIAVIRVPQLARQSVLTVEKESVTEIGDEVIALGSPHGFQNTVTLGIISGSDRNFTVDGFDYNNVYQISAQITHGNSGGPLINRNSGNVIGINSVGTEDGTIGFSIPINDVMEQIEKWSEETSNNELEFASMSDIINQYDPEQLKEDADYLIDYFFEGIKMRDYINAYTLLGSSMHSEFSYSRFREEYKHIVDITYEEASSDFTEDNHSRTITNVTIETKSRNEKENEIKTVEYIFIIGLENDQLKILNIEFS